MRKEILIVSMAILSFITINQARAECADGLIACGNNCAENDGFSTCYWEISSTGKLTVSGTGATKSYGEGQYKYSPWFNYRNNITSIKINDGITTIGDRAFEELTKVASAEIANTVTNIKMGAFFQQNLTSLVIPDSVKEIGFAAVYSNNLTSINIPDSVTSTGWWIFGANPNLKEIIVSDNLTSEQVDQWDARLFYGSNITKVRCMGDVEKCKAALKRYLPTSAGGYCSSNCLNSKVEMLPVENSVQCTGKYVWQGISEAEGSCRRMTENECNYYRDDNGNRKYYYNGSTCTNLPKTGKISCFGSSYKENDGYCDRIRYTPAEAAKVLRDDNTNEVTITFKK